MDSPPLANTSNASPATLGGWRSLFKPRIQPGLALSYVEPAIVNGRRVAKPSPEVFKKGALKWENTLVGQVLGFSFPISVNHRMVKNNRKK